METENKINTHVNKLSFPRNIFQFKELSEKFLSKSTQVRIQTIESIPEHFSLNEVSKVESIFYDFFKTKPFQELYKKFILDFLVPIYGKDLLYQAIPSIRVSFPGAKSVNFHNDCWYGHGENIKNIWIPLTNAIETQSLAFLSEQDNSEALDYIYREQPSLIKIQEYCEQRMTFMNCDYGKFLLFPTKALHGTVTNASDEIRVSFDFRICIDGNYGLKSKNFFKKISNNSDFHNSDYADNLIEAKLPVLGYLNQLDTGNGMQISQTVQQESIVSYCTKNQLSLLTLETELVGFRRPLNLEELLFGERSEAAKDIVVFSHELLHLYNDEYLNLIKKSLNNGYRFHCVNEGFIIENFDYLESKIIRASQ